MAKHFARTRKYTWIKKAVNPIPGGVFPNLITRVGTVGRDAIAQATMGGSAYGFMTIYLLRIGLPVVLNNTSEIL